MKEPIGVPTQASDEGCNRYSSQSIPNTKDKFTSNNDLQNFSLPLIQSDDDKESSFTEDVSPVRLSPGDAVCAEGVHVPNFVIQDMQGASLVPFQFIQGYASDNSEEKDEIDVTSVRTSSLAGLPNIHTDNKIEFKFASPSILSQRTVEGNFNKAEINFEPSKNHDIMETNDMDID
ncbi:uncharacterized protein LOC122036382 isoform X1 [Zingiber officinale]|uniref:uncharacterized protein LOC122036382 isoform X1 n=1 Tax=Zingiber officinale TaxID=94328 RepID=UPI001C4C955D|nr:uncharacterized protein LOC122036382 isoform X1 [Zingiber officinale]